MSSAMPNYTRGIANWNIVPPTSGTWVGPNVQWQNTSSNATYCSAKTALSLT